MLNDWYKKQRARKEAPHLLRGALGLPGIGIAAVFAARWALENANGFLSSDQANFMVASLVMIAVGAVVFCGYCGVRLTRLSLETGLALSAMLRSEED